MQHIISDFDGVLGDTAEMNWTLVQALHHDIKREKYFIDHHLGNVFDTPAVPFTRKTAGQYYQLYTSHLTVQHIERALPSIHQLGHRFTLHVVTSNCEHAIRKVFQDAGVEHLFGHILGQEAHASKVEKFDIILSELGLQPSETLYLTDTVGDLKEAAQAQLRTVAVTFGYHPRSLLEQHEPTALADNWPEVVMQVEALIRT